MAQRKIPMSTKYFKFDNVNPKQRRTGDCVIRALATASGKSWDEILDMLVEEAHRRKYSPASKECYGEVLKKLGFIKRQQPRKPDGTKYQAWEFTQWLREIARDPNERWQLAGGQQIVAHIGGHHIAAIMYGHPEGWRVVDIWDSSMGGTIGIWWVRKG